MGVLAREPLICLRLESKPTAYSRLSPTFALSWKSGHLWPRQRGERLAL